MKAILQGDLDHRRNRRRKIRAVRNTMRELTTQLSLLNQQVGGQLKLRQVDIDCLDLIDTYGPVSPTALARRAGMHPATMTGVLDRLERGNWIVRERDPGDRRVVVIRGLRDRSGEMLRLYAGMNRSMERIFADYTDEELRTIGGFLRRVADAGRAATEDLASG